MLHLSVAPWPLALVVVGALAGDGNAAAGLWRIAIWLSTALHGAISQHFKSHGFLVGIVVAFIVSLVVLGVLTTITRWFTASLETIVACVIVALALRGVFALADPEHGKKRRDLPRRRSRP